MMQAVAAAKVAEDILSEEGWYGVEVKPTLHKHTYFRPDERNTGKGLVVFGGKMVHMYTSGGAMQNAYKELRKCGFCEPYPFKWCPAAAAVMLVCHELAHVAVHRDQLRVFGSMHGGPFYRRMGELLAKYLDPMAVRFTVYAHDSGLLGDFPTRFQGAPAQARLNTALVEAYPAPSSFSGDFRKGDLVVFTFKGEKLIGRLTRRGKKRWTVHVDERPAIKYYIPEYMLRLCGKPEPAETCPMCDQPYSRQPGGSALCPACRGIPF